MRVSFLLLLVTGCAARVVEMPPKPVALPPIDVQQLDGAHATLSEQLAGRPALVSLWATWCDTCLTELGALGRLAPRAAEQGAFVVAISEGEDRATVSAFVRAKGLAYPQLVDEKFALSDALGARRVPATLVLDRAGRVVWRGAALDEAALKAFDRVIAETSPHD
ncbi:MAG: TlpA disulfide reductase family protein [Polyangia bacterium]